jgi:anti-sigma regulatory factor (Ser/Thr protein kinase)
VVSGVDDLGNGHVVQFYEHDEELADRVASYLRDVLDGRGAAIVIATAAHRQAIQARLSEAGADLTAAAGRGDYVVLDAEGTMAALTTTGTTAGTTAGRIDGTAFERVIGGVITSAGRGRRPVRVYGEMVALLWDSGDAFGAIHLESLWNDLAAASSFPFSLYCAYHAESVAGPEHAASLRRLCHLHTSVLSAPSNATTDRRPMSGYEVRAEFASKVTAPRAARHFVIDTLRQWDMSSVLIDQVALASSEMAANAVIHARSPFSVTLRADGALVRIEVRDTRPAVDQGRPRLVARPGRGLGVVAALSHRWGVEAAHAGKTVWAEFVDTEEAPRRARARARAPEGAR